MKTTAVHHIQRRSSMYGKLMERMIAERLYHLQKSFINYKLDSEKDADVKIRSPGVWY